MGRALSLIAALSLTAASARADYGVPIDPGWYAPLGMTGGWAMHEQRADGALAGLEVSVVHLDRDFLWAGAYLDAARDVADESFHVSFGPELGYTVFGVDGGYMLQLFDDHTRHGFTLRPMITFSYVALYGRYVRLLGEQAENQGSVGVLIKIPLELDVQHRRYAPQPFAPGQYAPPPPAWTPPGLNPDQPR